MKPNMIIVRLEGQLHSFDIVDGEPIDPSTPFESDYDINECQVVVAHYDADKHISSELLRITVLHEDEETKVLDCMRRGEFRDIVLELLEHCNEQPTLH